MAALVVTLRAAQFTSGVDLVEVYATVTTAAGQPIGGLTRTDFTILDSGRPQTIQAFAEAEFPLSVVVVIDRSFSMRGERLAAAKAAATALLAALRPADEAGVLAIGSRVEELAPLSRDRRRAETVIAGLDAFGTTGLHDATIRALDLSAGGRGRRALVLFSDGADRYSGATADEAVARARTSGVIVYPVNLSGRAVPFFSELAALTGGRAFTPKRPAAATGDAREIAAELGHQYLLGFAPARRGNANDTWRPLTVKAGRGLVVRTRDGYIPPD